MLEVQCPAPLVDTLGFIFRGGMAPPRHLKAAVLQCCAHESYGFRAEGKLVSAFGFWPIGILESRRCFEMWVVVGAESVPHLKALVQFARLALARLTQGNAVTVRALVRHNHKPGRRLAYLVGLRQTAVVEGFEVWEIHNEPVDQEPVRGRLFSEEGRRDKAATGSSVAPGATGEPVAPATGSTRRGRRDRLATLPRAPDASRKARPARRSRFEVGLNHE